MSALPPLEILHDDNHVLAVVKPTGLPTVPDDSGDESLLDQAREWVRVRYDKPGNVFLGVVHRLDRPVSGVVVFARTSKAAARLTDRFRTRSVEKEYWARGEAGPEGGPSSGTLVQWLAKDRHRNMVAVVEAGEAEAKEAVTDWRRVATAGPEATLVFHPHTGRSHQLRVAAATLGHPLLGDLKYGATAPLPDRSVALHARTLRFRHPTRDEEVSLVAPLPGVPWWDELRDLGEI